MKQIGEKISWPDVQGRIQTGTVVSVKYICYEVRTEEGYVLEVSKKGENKS